MTRLAFALSQHCHRSLAAGVEVPQPAPDVVPLPPSPHPIPPSESPVPTPPEINEPTMPGEHAPVRDPIVPGDVGRQPFLH